jgi:CIC family chloride channel protein
MGLGALKLVATSLTLGSGASGGVFSPALFMGATVGAAYGIGLHDLFPGLELGVVACAVAGMAALVGGATGAPMMAIVMTFEMTRDYQVILPMTLAVVLSYGVRRVIGRHSIYTFKLARRGEFVPDALQANFNYIKHAEDVMSTGVATMPSETPLERWRGKGASEDLPAYVVATSGGEAVGFARRDAVLSSAARSPSGTALGDVVQSRFVRVVYGTPILGVLAILRDAGVRTALVVNGGQPPGTEVVGVITPDELQDAVEQAVELFAD